MKSANLLFFTSVSGLKEGSLLTLLRMNCSVAAYDFLIPGFIRYQVPSRVCFALIMNKTQGQSITVSFGIDLNSPCCSHG